MGADAATPEPTPDIPPGLPAWAWPAGVLFLAAANFLLLLPSTLSFQLFLVADQGWATAADAAWAAGLRPVTDFSYFYGLLTLVIDRGWFAAFGRTPISQAALMGVCGLGIAVGVIRFARNAGLGPTGKAILLAAAPLATMPISFPSPTHALEPLLLVNALAFHARGRVGAALVLAVTAVFVKPSLAMLYAAWLVAIILRDGGPRAKRMLPAAGVGVGLSLLLTGLFGADALFHTLVPTDASKVYAAENYGFFRGVGSRFVLPETPSIGYYALSPAGFWLAASIVTWAGTAVLIRGRVRTPADSALVMCGLLHAAFVLFFFGNQQSWVYYAYLPIFAAAGVIDRVGVPGRPAYRVLGILLAVAAVCGQAAQLGYASIAWREAVRPPDTAGLFAMPADAAAWADLRATVGNSPTLILSRTGAAAELFPGIDAPRGWFLLKPTATPGEIDRVNAQIRAAEWVIVPKAPDASLHPWPEFRDELTPFRAVKDYPSFLLAKRTPRAPQP